MSSLRHRCSPPPALLAPLLALLALACALLGCPSPAPTWPEADGFDDHTLARVDSPAHFAELARTGPSGTAALKFVIVNFGDAEAQELRILDGRFYEFHDEWYWFRLLNGQPVPGTRERPVTGQRFDDIEAIVDWIGRRDRPAPLGLRSIDERLYSDLFYELAVHREQRSFGIGTLVHMPARAGEHPREELWAFELEYADALEADALELFFASLRASLPSAIAEQLRFVARSPEQSRLVARLRAQDHPLAPRLSSYAELAVPGEIEVYNPGLIAGRLRKLPEDPARAEALLTTGDPNAIWMLPAIPDELPAAAGLLTAVPQTPLAHVNLLARNRGIPNAYLGGLLDDPNLDQLSRIHAFVVVLAERDGTLRIEPISEQAYARWLGLSQSRRPQLAPLEVEGLPYTLDLEAQELAAVPALRRSVGGKAAGFPVLHAARATIPKRALAITIRPYLEHLAELRQAIADALADPGFRGDPRVRYLLLEGRKDFDARFASARDQAWVEDFTAAHPPSAARRDPLAQLLARDGIKRAIRDRPLDPEAAAAIDEALRAHYGHLAPTQGLRFRSSSTIEDVEGFSGAGLYDSNTGFLDPAAQAKPKNHKKSVAWALRKTWASYWSWEAFEERRMAGIDHLAGAMAVLVHPRFDDDLEQRNGVITLTLDLTGERPGAAQAAPGPRVQMEVNTQLGALSVTNPPPERAGEILPEVARLRVATADAAPQIERISASTEQPDAPLLDDPALLALLRETTAIAEQWLALEARGRSPAAARSRVTLDLEFRAMAPGWPARADGRQDPARVVIKQVRSLDPGIASALAALRDQPIPRELLAHAARVERRSCSSRRARLDLLEVWTRDMVEPPIGFAARPFLARARVRVSGGLRGGPRQLELDHTEFVSVARPGMDRGGPWSLELLFGPEADPSGVGLDRVEVTAGLMRLMAGASGLDEAPAQCSVELLFASPEQFLRSLL